MGRSNAKVSHDLEGRTTINTYEGQREVHDPVRALFHNRTRQQQGNHRPEASETYSGQASTCGTGGQGHDLGDVNPTEGGCTIPSVLVLIVKYLK